MFNTQQATQNTSGKPQAQRQDFGPTSQGQHVGRIVRVVGFGMQDVANPFKPDAEPTTVFQVTVELPNERITAKDKDGNEQERPRWIWSKDVPIKFFKDYNTNVVRLHEKSKAHELLNAVFPSVTSEWTPELVGEYLNKMVGEAVSILVSHRKSKKTDKVYDNIQQFVPVMKGMTVGELENETLVYNPYEHDDEAFKKLPNHTQERINNRLDNEGAQPQPQPQPQPQAQAQAQPTPQPNEVEYGDQDIPF